MLDEDIMVVRFGNVGFVDEELLVNMDDFLLLGVMVVILGMLLLN